MRSVKLLLLALILWALLTSFVWAEDEPVVHVVQPGENLFRISLHYDTTVEAIMAANGLTDPTKIYVGQELVIPDPAAAGGDLLAGPSGGAPGAVYALEPEAGLLSLAARLDLLPWTLLRANRLTSPARVYPGQRLVVPAESLPGDTYVFRRDDSLDLVATRTGVDAARLARLNGVLNPTSVYVGQVLRLNENAPVVEPGSGKRILVDLSEQHLYAYYGDQLVYSFVVSTGASPSVTQTGHFHVQSKLPKAYGSTWDLWMPYWMGIYYAGSSENGFHALPILSNGQTLWAGYLGTPISYGCVVLGTYQAKLLYEWTPLGTPVEIRH